MMKMKGHCFVFLFLLIAPIRNGITISDNDLYDYYNQGEILPRGDTEYEFVKLETPIHFYSQTYDHIYINTNGILSFSSELSEFSNLPFPLEYPAIAPFYSNVDTTLTNDTAGIIFFTTHASEVIDKVTELVRNGFEDASDFHAKSVFIATWENVGHYDRKNNAQNTFQAAIICSDEETYVQFLYPQDGLNWIQGEVGESGLPDVRAQAGFVSEDGRFFTLKGSGTENVRYLSQLTNYGVPGIWLYRVGPLGYDDNVVEPDRNYMNGEPLGPLTCIDGGRLKCHSAAFCNDTRTGFCCICKDGYYGNGLSCIKKDIPLRVSGTVTGSIGYHNVTTQLQSYVVTADGRSYTAVSPLEPEIGPTMQFLQIIGGPIGWLFAKPVGNVHNGYQLTGGKFNHTATLRFEQNAGKIFYINQRFKGLNVWDQLSVEIELYGELPDLPYGVKVQLPDYVDEYSFTSDTTLRSVASRRILIPDTEEELVFQIDQQISFEKCKFVEQRHQDYPPVAIKEKVTKVSAVYEAREQALRISSLNRIGLETDTLSPCEDGTAICGENTICIPSEDNETYDCQCKNGYAPNYVRDGVEHCSDIDECSGTNICDENAECYNELGGYSCICRPGYHGNGYQCNLIHAPSERPLPDVTTETERPYPSESSPESYPCDYCSENADCIQEECICRNGYTGDGYECNYNCDQDSEWIGNKCVPYQRYDDTEPNCTSDVCICPPGYELIEHSFKFSCRWRDFELDPYDPFDSHSPTERFPCDIENNCSENANCEMIEDEDRYECICNPGYDGDGYNCLEKPISCAEEDICDPHASCNYNATLRVSTCQCDPGYEGDGRSCHLVPECLIHDDCGINSVCDVGVCVCQDGFERDLSDFCVPAGSCGGAFCAENAVCQWNPVQKVSYCYCPQDFIGDGIHSCKSIPPPCNIRNNCGLYASCVPNYRDISKYECICDSGYYGDGFVCTPEINCINVPTLCDKDATCSSTTSGLRCICNQGFIGNGSICTEVPHYDTGFLLISQGVAVVRVPFDGVRGRPVSMSQMAIGVDKDCTEGRVYWSDISAKGIFSSKYDGTDKKPFITENILSPEGVAVDWISRRIYWTDSNKDTIEVASLDDPTLRAVIVKKHLVNPRGIAVDPNQSKLFWSDWNRDGPKIEWSNLDGTERQILLSDPVVKLPNSLSMAPRTGEVCFADAGTQKIGCVDTYSRNLRTVAANLSYPFGLAITDDHFYWTDWTTKKIESIDLQGVRKSGLTGPLFGSHKMYGMTAVTQRCHHYYSQCQVNNGDCPPDRICLANPRSPSGRSCKCTNSHNCNEIHLDD